MRDVASSLDATSLDIKLLKLCGSDEGVHPRRDGLGEVEACRSSCVSICTLVLVKQVNRAPR
jgi:hypothetical protein